ncbi:MAG: hypothetical protein FDZ75_06100, partial [Actinobacteria bacterium]
MVSSFGLKHVSTRTWIVGALGAFGVAATYTLMHMSASGPQIQGLLNNLPSVALTFIAALITAWCAVQFERSSIERRTLIYLAAGAGFYALGSVAWAYIEMFQGVEVPFPGPPDLFFLLQYVPLTLAAWAGLLSFSGRVKLGPPLVISGVLVVATGAFLAYPLGDQVTGEAAPLQVALS